MSAAAAERLQLASLPLQVRAVKMSEQLANESFASRSAAAWQCWLNSVGWFFQYPGEQGGPSGGGGGSHLQSGSAQSTSLSPSSSALLSQISPLVCAMAT